MKEKETDFSSPCGVLLSFLGCGFSTVQPNARCPVCKVQKKGSCGTDTSPARCYRRQFNGLPFTPLSHDDMMRFAGMVLKRKSQRTPKKSKEEIRRQKLDKHISNKFADAEKAAAKAAAAAEQAQVRPDIS